ncbi:hypothetical protein DFH27DRAFT_607088 [Peziza echinospora]|nr:hypothetical protein DFH27DRAFT_607088 [Peziza echinospora]
MGAGGQEAGGRRQDADVGSWEVGVGGVTSVSAVRPIEGLDSRRQASPERLDGGARETRQAVFACAPPMEFQHCRHGQQHECHGALAGPMDLALALAALRSGAPVNLWTSGFALESVLIVRAVRRLRAAACYACVRACVLLRLRLLLGTYDTHHGHERAIGVAHTEIEGDWRPLEGGSSEKQKKQTIQEYEALVVGKEESKKEKKERRERPARAYKPSYGSA